VARRKRERQLRDMIEVVKELGFWLESGFVIDDEKAVDKDGGCFLYLAKECWACPGSQLLASSTRGTFHLL
jgi:hypothetical protein